MLLNTTLCHIFVEHQTSVIFMGVVAEHKFETVPETNPMGCL